MRAFVAASLLLLATAAQAADPDNPFRRKVLTTLQEQAYTKAASVQITPGCAGVFVACDSADDVLLDCGGSTTSFTYGMQSIQHLNGGCFVRFTCADPADPTPVPGLVLSVQATCLRYP